MKHIIHGREMDTYTAALQISYDNAMDKIKELEKKNRELDIERRKLEEQIKHIRCTFLQYEWSRWIANADYEVLAHYIRKTI